MMSFACAAGARRQQRGRSEEHNERSAARHRGLAWSLEAVG
jgi:hypothetical protein